MFMSTIFLEKLEGAVEKKCNQIGWYYFKRRSSIWRDFMAVSKSFPGFCCVRGLGPNVLYLSKITISSLAKKGVLPISLFVYEDLAISIQTQTSF